MNMLSMETALAVFQLARGWLKRLQLEDAYWSEPPSPSDRKRTRRAVHHVGQAPHLRDVTVADWLIEGTRAEEGPHERCDLFDVCHSSMGWLKLTFWFHM
jgi:hypothetical protein